MLSSTAEHLYWMARSMERAENIARMLDVTYRMSLLKNTTTDAVDQEWIAVLSISGLFPAYSERHSLVSSAVRLSVNRTSKTKHKPVMYHLAE